jgi:diguanylate cyclase (GGDEF)-like protein
MADAIAGIDYDPAITKTGMRFRKPVPLAERKLREENITDFKTGLLNERGLSKDMENKVLHAERTGENLTVVFIDADDFKGVNTKYKYVGGDTVLRLIAKAMNEEFRREDSKSRWGGDEFVGLMSTEKDKGSIDVQNLSQRINSNIKSSLPENINPNDVSVTLATREWQGESAADLLQKVQDYILEKKAKNV